MNPFELLLNFAEVPFASTIIAKTGKAILPFMMKIKPRISKMISFAYLYIDRRLQNINEEASTGLIFAAD